jgi:hypothetical protein
MVDPDPVRKLTTPAGKPMSSSIRINWKAIAGEVLAGLSTTVLPVTKEALVIPVMMAAGKFHGGMTAPTPSGMYTSSFSSFGIFVIGCSPP